MISYARSAKGAESGGILATAANVLSFFRILSVPVILVLVLRSGDGSSTAATIIFIAAALTDLLDGILARSTGTVTEVGKVLDPLADRILIGGTVIGLAAAGALPAWGVTLVVARDILLVIGYKALEKRGVILRVSMLGKSYTAFFMVAIVATMAGIKAGGLNLGLLLFWISVAGSIVSGISYAARGIYLLKVRTARR